MDPALRVVWELLERSFPESARVLHARNTALPGERWGAFRREDVDFLVVDDQGRFLAIEVIPGSVWRKGVVWFCRDEDGTDQPIPEPGQRARTAVRAIGRHLQSRPLFRKTGLRPEGGIVVVLPDARIEGEPGESLPRDRILDARDLERAADLLPPLFESGGRGPVSTPARAAHTVLLDLAGELNLVRSVFSPQKDRQEAFLRLTEEQTKILEMLEDFPRLAVLGPAGTGKTLLAVEQARRLSAERMRVLYLCFHQRLAEHLAAVGTTFAVSSFHRLCAERARRAGIYFDPPEENDSTHATWDYRAPEFLMQALASEPANRYDAVIVDEGHHFRQYWWLAVEALHHDPRTGVLLVFSDPALSSPGSGPADALSMNTFPLHLNCRSTIRIAVWAYDQVERTPRLRECAERGDPVAEIIEQDPGRMVERIGRVLAGLAEEGVPPERTLVLAVEGAVDPDDLPVGEFDSVEFGTLGPADSHGGLEADAVLLVGVRKDTDPALLYRGASRARKQLFVFRK
jgi:Type III restriction enzyme, res subunit